MVLIVLLVLALFVLQTLLPGRFREPARGGQGQTDREPGKSRSHAAADGGRRTRDARARQHARSAAGVSRAGAHEHDRGYGGRRRHGRFAISRRARAVRGHLHGGNRRGAHAGVGRELGRPCDDDRAAAREDRKRKAPGLYGAGGFSTTRKRGIRWRVAASASASSSARAAVCDLLSSVSCRAGESR